MDERQAIASLKRGDIAGLEVLVRRYQARALEVAFLTGGNYPLAEDVVQDAFLRVYERIGQFDPERPFAPWFMRIVINDTLKALRRRAPEPLDTAALDATSGEGMPTHLKSSRDAESLLIDLETKAEIFQALEQLKPRQRAVIVARYYLDIDDADLASRLNITRGTVRWHLAVAHQRLRRLLSIRDTSGVSDVP